MFHDYDDITSAIDMDPFWWDDNGVPRYKMFHPKMLPNIYAKEAALIGIECQGCGNYFRVSISKRRVDPGPDISIMIEDNDLHYGDPPNHNCYAAGDSMNSIPIQVLEYWSRRGELGGQWWREPRYEIDLDK